MLQGEKKCLYVGTNQINMLIKTKTMNRISAFAGAALLAAPVFAQNVQLDKAPETVTTCLQGRPANGLSIVNPPSVGIDKDETTGFPGNIEAPDSETFEALLNTQEDFDRFYNFSTDYGDPANYNFRKGWYFSAFSECACILNYIDEEAYDEWLITPAIEMEAGKKYVISFILGTDSWFQRSMMELKAGDTPTVEAMTETVCEPFTFIVDDNTNPQCGFYFTPARTGTYHIGFHAMNEAGKGGFRMTSVRISSPEAETIPSEDEIEYEETVLMDEDLTTLTEGTYENPFKLTTTSAMLDGMDGWMGNEVYSVGGQGLLIKNTLGEQGNGAVLIPKFAETQNFKKIRYSLTLTSPEFSSIVTGTDYMRTYLLHGNTALAPYAYNTEGTIFQNTFSMNQDMTYNWILDMPEEPAMMVSANGATMFGEYDVDCVSLFIQASLNSNIIIKKIKVTGIVPKVAAPATRLEKLENASATVAWDAVDGADDYIVRVYRNAICLGSGDYELGGYEQTRTSETSLVIDNIDTSRAAVVVEVFALGQGTRSPKSTLRVIENEAPQFAISETDDNKVHLEWNTDTQTIGTFVNLLKGEKLEEANPAYIAARISTEGMADDNSSMIYFPGQEASWYASGDAISLKDGEICNDNAVGFNSLSIISDAAYDFSKAERDVTFKITARAEGNTMMNVAFVAPDNDTQQLSLIEHKYVALGYDYDTYVVTLPAHDCARIELMFRGSSKVYFKDLEISCSLPAGAIFYKPAASVFVRNYGETQGITELAMPEAPFDNLMAWGMNARYEYYDETTPARIDYTPYGTPAILEKSMSGVEDITTEIPGNAPVYYNLQGIRVDNPADGIFVKVENGKSSKVVVK